MPISWSKKIERQYEHVKTSELEAGRSTKRSKQIAAATVNEQRLSQGRSEI